MKTTMVKSFNYYIHSFRNGHYFLTAFALGHSFALLLFGMWPFFLLTLLAMWLIPYTDLKMEEYKQKESKF